MVAAWLRPIPGTSLPAVRREGRGEGAPVGAPPKRPYLVPKEMPTVTGMKPVLPPLVCTET
jgi:hypothetical protein